MFRPLLGSGDPSILTRHWPWHHGAYIPGGKTDIKRELPHFVGYWELSQNDFSEEVASGLSSEEFTRQKLVNAESSSHREGEGREFQLEEPHV